MDGHHYSWLCKIFINYKSEIITVITPMYNFVVFIGFVGFFNSPILNCFDQKTNDTSYYQDKYYYDYDINLNSSIMELPE